MGENGIKGRVDGETRGKCKKRGERKKTTSKFQGRNNAKVREGKIYPGGNFFSSCSKFLSSSSLPEITWLWEEIKGKNVKVGEEVISLI